MYGIFTYILLDFYGFHLGKYIPAPWMVWVKEAEGSRLHWDCWVGIQWG